MSQEFTLARSDFIAFQKEVTRLLRKNMPSRGGLFLSQIVVWIFVGLAVSLAVRLYMEAPEYQSLLVTIGCSVVVAVSLGLAIKLVATPIAQKYFLRDDGVMLSSRTITLDEESLKVAAQSGAWSSSFLWSAFLGRTEDKLNLYLFLDPGYGFIVPKAAVDGSELELIQKKLNAL